MKEVKSSRSLHNIQGRAIAQAVSCWLPTTATRVRSRVWSSGIYGGHSSVGAGFLLILRFPLPILIPPVASQSSSPIIWGQKWPQYKGLSPTPLAIKKNRLCSTQNGPHRKRLIQQFFSALGTSLPSCYLTTIRGYVDPQIHTPSNSSLVCIRCSGNVFTEPLPSNSMRDTIYRVFAQKW
jgi:hypothetical protein